MLQVKPAVRNGEEEQFKYTSMEANKLLIHCAEDVIITDDGIMIELELKGEKLEVEFRHDAYCRKEWEQIVDLAIERMKEIQDYNKVIRLAKGGE
jgi:hypothetical protein